MRRHVATVYVPAYAFFNFLNLISLVSLRGLADFEPNQLNLETRFFSRIRYRNLKGFEPKKIEKKVKGVFARAGVRFQSYGQFPDI